MDGSAINRIQYAIPAVERAINLKECAINRFNRAITLKERANKIEPYIYLNKSSK